MTYYNKPLPEWSESQLLQEYLSLHNMTAAHWRSLRLHKKKELGLALNRKGMEEEIIRERGKPIRSK